VHLLLQTRVRTLKRELGTVVKRWYLAMAVEGRPAAASSPGSPCAHKLMHCEATTMLRNAAHGRDLSEVLPQLGEEWLLRHTQP